MENIGKLKNPLIGTSTALEPHFGHTFLMLQFCDENYTLVFGL